MTATVSSSMIEQVSYNPEKKQLSVKFRKTGRIYRSTVDVPQEIYDGLVSAESAGKFYNARVVGKYGMAAE